MTIDEQIARQEAVIRHCEGKVGVNIEGDKAILASIQCLKAIESVQVPEEPTMLSAMRMVGNAPEVIKHVDTLRDLLKEEKANGVAWENTSQHWQSRAEAAERQLTAMLKDAERWKETAEYFYGEKRKFQFGEEESKDYPVKGALDAWFNERYGIKEQSHG